MIYRAADECDTGKDHLELTHTAAPEVSMNGGLFHGLVSGICALRRRPSSGGAVAVSQPTS
jgi:hypothetical protein